MTKKFVVLLLGSALATGLWAGAPQSRQLQAGDTPNAQTPLLLSSGQRSTLGGLRGNIVLVNFFITG